ncbi:MAG TPA: VOC family protein, partial [Candidatus Tumulicola sp.]
MPNPVVHFEIVTGDPDAQIDFMQKAFDWKIDTQFPGTGVNVPKYFPVMPNGDQPPSKGVNGGIAGTPEGYGGHVTFYVGVESVEESLAKIASLGGTRMMGPDQVPNGAVIGLFLDPQGHAIGLVEIGDDA